MSRSLGTLTLDLVARVGGFEAGMKKASRSSKSTSQEIRKHASTISKAVGGAAVAAAAGLTLIINRERDLIDQSAKTAQTLQTTYTSIANLERAGELGGIGFDKISAAGEKLNLNIGEAIQGTNAQVKAFERLGISAEDLSKIPLDQRIAKVNDALRDNVQASERAAVAADIFGARNGAAIQRLDSDAIAEAARQVEIFGLNLSDVDAAKVEQANDALSTIGMAASGASKQLTVELAPILDAIGDMFLDAADKAGGMGDAVENSVDRAVRSLSFVIDAGDGISRVFTVIADTIIGVFVTAQFRALEAVSLIGEALDNLPGIDIDTDGLRKSANEARMIADEAAANIKKQFEEPLAGTKFIQFVDDAREASTLAAEAAVSAREAAKETGSAFEEVNVSASKSVDAIEKQIKALELQAVTMDMNNKEVALYKLSMDGATEAQLAQADAVLVSIDAYKQKEQAMKDAEQAIKDAEADRDRDRTEVAGVMDFLKTEEEKLAESYEARRQIIIDSTTLSEEEKAATILELNQKLNDDLIAMEQQRKSAMLQSYATLFDELGGLATQFSGEQSGIARAMFAVSKGFAIADSIVKIQQGIASAASLTFPANIPAMASVASATAGIVTTIQGTELQGMAHDGVMSVPKTGTWLLEEGERVTTANTSAKLDQTLDDVRSGMGGGESSQGVRIVNAVDPDLISDYMGSSRGEKIIMNVISKNQRAIRSFAS